MLAVIENGGVSRTVNAPGGAAISACGLAAWEGRIFCAYTQGERSFLAVCDARADGITETIALPGVRDVHSIVLDADGIVAASTGHDEVVRIGWNGAVETLWRVSADSRDEHHVNGLCFFEGRLLCSAFGPRIGPSWADAIDGYVYDITRSQYVARGLYQPHSLAPYGAAIYCCESARGAIRSLAADIQYVPGYARGLAFDENGSYAAGCSVARSAAAWPAYLNPADRGGRTGSCALYFGSVHGMRTSCVDLEPWGEEIYDVLALV